MHKFSRLSAVTGSVADLNEVCPCSDGNAIKLDASKAPTTSAVRVGVKGTQSRYPYTTLVVNQL